MTNLWDLNSDLFLTTNDAEFWWWWKLFDNVHDPVNYENYEDKLMRQQIGWWIRAQRQNLHGEQPPEHLRKI